MIEIAPPPLKHDFKEAFTLIELSIVLVIIGLIVGGVLVGRDLIKAAEVRSQVSQIEKLNSAANTFRSKFNNYLPGDIPEPYASQFGFDARGTVRGQGDGNGVMEGNYVLAGCLSGAHQKVGENKMFWVDLKKAELIAGNYLGSASAWTGGSSSQLFPAGAIGQSYVIVFSSDWSGTNNYFGLQGTGNDMTGCGLSNYGTPITAQQAYNIDKKIDDGLPSTGTVISTFASQNALFWTQPVTFWGGGMDAPASMGAYGIAATSSTCMDNGGVGGARVQYSITYNNGAGVNCSVSFKFQ